MSRTYDDFSAEEKEILDKIYKSKDIETYNRTFMKFIEKRPDWEYLAGKQTFGLFYNYPIFQNNKDFIEEYCDIGILTEYDENNSEPFFNNINGLFYEKYQPIEIKILDAIRLINDMKNDISISVEEDDCHE